MIGRRRHVDGLLREADQLDAALARLELGIAELAVEQCAAAAVLAAARFGGPATRDVPRLAVVRGETRAHDRRAHPA